MDAKLLSKAVLATVLCIALAATSGFALLVDDMQIALMPTYYYSEASHSFDLTFTGSGDAYIATGLMSTVNDSSYAYNFNGTVGIASCALIEDQSSGGLAAGKFTGGATLTITGDLWLASDPGNKIVTNGVILQAQMDSEPWYMVELQSPPAQSDTVRGQAEFTTTGGALFTGEGANLQLHDFRIDMTFPDTTPVVTNFTSFGGSATDEWYVCSNNPHLQFIPEPATMALLAFGLLILRNRR